MKHMIPIKADNHDNYKRTKYHLQGTVIKDIYKQTEKIAFLHATLTSPRGEFFRQNLLRMLADGLTAEEILQLTKKFGLDEYKRHINKLVDAGFIAIADLDGKEGYIRTTLGEEAVNALRELERKIGPEKMKAIYMASLGMNSLRLFLKVYGHQDHTANVNTDIIYTPLKIGQLSAFLPRTIEGLAAIDKLDDAGLVSYLEDGNIHVNPRRCVAFYQYLKRLFGLIENEHN